MISHCPHHNLTLPPLSAVSNANSNSRTSQGLVSPLTADTASVQETVRFETAQKTLLSQARS